MAYDSNTGICTCDFCGFNDEQDASDDVYGELWGCDECGKMFCSKCIKDKFGVKAYMDMLRGSDTVCCPECQESGRESK